MRMCVSKKFMCRVYSHHAALKRNGAVPARPLCMCVCACALDDVQCVCVRVENSCSLASTYGFMCTVCSTSAQNSQPHPCPGAHNFRNENIHAHTHTHIHPLTSGACIRANVSTNNIAAESAEMVCREKKTHTHKAKLHGFIEFTARRAPLFFESASDSKV